MEQTFRVQVTHVDTASIWTNRTTKRTSVHADIPGHGRYSCPVATYARMIRKSRQELIDRIKDVNDGWDDSPDFAQYESWPKPLLAVMCGEWEGD